MSIFNTLLETYVNKSCFIVKYVSQKLWPNTSPKSVLPKIFGNYGQTVAGSKLLY